MDYSDQKLGNTFLTSHLHLSTREDMKYFNLILKKFVSRFQF